MIKVLKKEELQEIWGKAALEYPEIVQFIEARLLLSKAEAEEAVDVALKRERMEREARVKGTVKP